MEGGEKAEDVFCWKGGTTGSFVAYDSKKVTDSFISTSFDIFSPSLRCKLGQHEFVCTYLIKHIVQISVDSTNFYKGFMLVLGGHVKNTTCAAMSPNGQWVVSGKGVKP